MTEIYLKEVENNLDAAKKSCYHIGSEYRTDPYVRDTLASLITAIEQLSEAVKHHYHTTPE
jgi:hypothetical protein